MTLHEKRILVLGGSSGIGLAVAQAAAREGATVVIASSRQARVDEALKTLPQGAEGHALDLSDETAVRALFAQLGEAALDVRQRNVGDRRIDRLHNRRQHDRDRDGGAIDLRGNKAKRSTSIGLDAPRKLPETRGLTSRGDVDDGRNGITHFAVATMIRTPPAP